MVPLGLPSARPMAQALRLPFEYYIVSAKINDDVYKNKQKNILKINKEVGMLLQKRPIIIIQVE